MSYEPIKTVREYLAGTGRALDRGDAASAARELVIALQHCFSMVRNDNRARDDVAREVSKLPPSLLRQALRLIDERA